MAVIPSGFSLWNFVAGIVFAMFVLPMILNFIGKKSSKKA
jgi:hypothetical protein